jgi:hypothetical protein
MTSTTTNAQVTGLHRFAPRRPGQVRPGTQGKPISATLE